MKKKCAACQGFGRNRVTRLQEAKIPPGFKPNGIYTVQSRDLKTEKKYDLFVRVRLALPAGIRVEMSDVVCEYPLSEKIARDGGEIAFDWLWGKFTAPVPKGAPAEFTRIFPGCGLPSEPSGGKRGDLSILFKRMSDRKARRAVKKFRSNLSNVLAPYRPGWWQRFF